jgi:cytochrome c oxidase cbb3-type subunit 3
MTCLSFKDSEWYKKLMAKLTKTEPLESEGQLLLDHDYDGIKELDNNLPPWWVYLFYASIVLELFIWFDTKFCADNQEMELKRSRSSKIDIAEYMKTAPDMMDEKR